MEPQTLNYLIWQKERGLTYSPSMYRSASKEKSFEESLRESSFSCRKCSLAVNRQTPLWGTGSADCKVAFVGDLCDQANVTDNVLPGNQFELLGKIISAIKLSLEEVFVCNLLLCPGDINNLSPQNHLACREYFLAQMTAASPQFIVTMGELATQNITGRCASLDSAAGEWARYTLNPEIRVMPIFHPRDMIIEPKLKIKTWAGLQKLMTQLP